MDESDALRIAANENLLRERNERVKASNAVHVWVDPPFPDWTCECGRPACTQPIRLSMEEYEAVRASPTQFVVAPGKEHVAHDFERVVRREDRYWVVDKIGVGAVISEAFDPRSTDD